MTDSQNKSDGETESEWKKRVKRLESQTVLDTLETLGFDTDDRNETQRDLIFLRKLRTANERNSAKAVAGLIGLFFTLVGALATIFAQSYIFPKG